MEMFEPDSRLDVELAEWFSRRAGAWSGTAGELLVSLRTSVDDGSLSSLTSTALHAYLQSHTQRLRSLGVEVLLQNGIPRRVTLRSPLHEPQRKSPSSAPNRVRESDQDLSSTVIVSSSAHGAAIPGSSGSESIDGSNVVNSNSLEKFSAAEPGEEGAHKEGFFSNTGDALFAIVEMRRQIQEQGLDLEATVDLVIDRAQEITKCCGVAVGFLPQEIGTRPPGGRLPQGKS